jgi:hypothetical protein
MRKSNTNSGRNLNSKWKVGAHHALYSVDGTFYNMLRRFPGALFDSKGYILFKTQTEFNLYLVMHFYHSSDKINCPKGISSLPAYKRVLK